MLYQPRPLDFNREILVFVHVPKTGGTLLEDALADHVGQERFHTFHRFQRIGHVYPNRLLKAFYLARKFAVKSALQLRGIHPLMRNDYRKLDLDQQHVLTGHIALGSEPKTGRKPIMSRCCAILSTVFFPTITIASTSAPSGRKASANGMNFGCMTLIASWTTFMPEGGGPRRICSVSISAAQTISKPRGELLKNGCSWRRRCRG